MSSSLTPAASGTSRAPSATSAGSGPSVPPQVISIGLGFIATAFFVVVTGFILRMFLARRRAQAEGHPSPSWLEAFFSIVESRNPDGRGATSGFLYFEPGFGTSRRGRGDAKGVAEDMIVPTLFDCDIELGTEKAESNQIADMQIASIEIQPMTAYNKLPNTTDPTAILPGNQLGISLLIRMPTAPQHHHAHLLDEEPTLPEISIGVVDFYVAHETLETPRDSEEKWMREGKAVKKQEVQHLEYR